jgi:hypothetical protein
VKAAAKSEKEAKKSAPLRMFLIPCSCGTTFAVAENYDHQGTAWSRYLVCPGCGKRHDPRNRLLQIGFILKVIGKWTSARLRAAFAPRAS